MPFKIKVSVEGVSLTSQRSSLIAVDTAGKPLRSAIMWQDRRTAEICNELFPQQQQIYQRTGLRVSPVFLGPKIAWLKRCEPDTHARAAKFLGIAEYVLFLLTGLFVTDTTYAGRSLLFNLATLNWDQNQLDLFGAGAGQLGKIFSPGQIVGQVSPHFGDLTGLPAGIPVVSAGGDQQCAALGSGVIDEGEMQITSGTGTYLIAPSASIRLDPKMRSVCSPSAVAGTYIVESSILATSVIYQWLAQLLHCAPGDKDWEQDLLVAPAGANGLVALPHFQGRGSPDWNTSAKGIFYNLTLGTTRGDMGRAILEGIGVEIGECFSAMRELGLSPSCIRVSDGLTKFGLFNQITDDILDQPVTVISTKEASSLGAWASFAVANGLFSSHAAALAVATDTSQETTYVPIQENVERYLVLRKTNRSLYTALQNVQTF